MVQTVVDSSMHASQLLSQVPVCTWEIHNTIQVPERAVSVVFRRNRAIELQTSLSEGDRMRVEVLRPLGTSMSGTCWGWDAEWAGLCFWQGRILGIHWFPKGMLFMNVTCIRAHVHM